MNFHPYSEIFPLIEGAEFDALVGDIKEHGLREKIWLYKGKILDGRNRFLACKKAKVSGKTRNFKGDDAAALAFVISVNDRRRHLTPSQRAMAASRIKDAWSSLNLDSGDRAELAATSQKVSRASVFHADKVREKGSSELQKAVDAGEVSVSKAASVVDLPRAKQLTEAKKKAEPPKPIEVSPPPDFDFEGYEPEDDEAYKANIENVMMADDKLAAMREELKQCHREIQALKSSRDHYQTQAGEAVRLVKARDREIEKLKRELEKTQRAA